MIAIILGHIIAFILLLALIGYVIQIFRIMVLGKEDKPYPRKNTKPDANQPKVNQHSKSEVNITFNIKDTEGKN